MFVCICLHVGMCVCTHLYAIEVLKMHGGNSTALLYGGLHGEDLDQYAYLCMCVLRSYMSRVALIHT